jgi:hypothetical protein
MLADPDQFHNPSYRDAALQMLNSAIAQGQGMERLDTRYTALEQQLGKLSDDPALRAQVEEHAAALGIPLTEDLQPDFSADIQTNPEGLQTAVYQMEQLLGLVDKTSKSGGGMSNDQKSVVQHMMAVAAVTREMAPNVGIEDYAKTAAQALEGNVQAQLKMQALNRAVDDKLNTEKWTKGQREGMDQVMLTNMVAQGTGRDPATVAGMADHIFQFAINDNPAVASEMLRQMDRMGGLSESTLTFMTMTGNKLVTQPERAQQHEVAAALAGYAVLKQNPSAMQNADLPAPVAQGLENLWRAGYRGVAMKGGFRLDGGPVESAGAVATRPINVGNDAGRLASLGLDPKEASVEYVRERLRVLQGDGLFSFKDVAYPAELEVLAHDHAVQASIMGGDFDDTLSALLRSNFEQIGYGRSHMTLTGPNTRQGADDGALVFNAPATVLDNDFDRRNPLGLERIAQEVLAERFSHVKGLVDQPERIRFTGIERADDMRYDSPSGLIRERALLAVPTYINDNGLPEPLLDSEGRMVEVMVNEVMEEAVRRQLEKGTQIDQFMRGLLQPKPMPY